MKVYIATKLQNIERAKEMKKLIEETGHQVTARWISAEYPVAEFEDERITRARKAALDDYKDIIDSDIFILLEDPIIFSKVGSYTEDSKLAGKESVNRYVELGIAIGLRKKIFVIGRKHKTIFTLAHHLIRTFGNEEAVLEWFRNFRGVK